MPKDFYAKECLKKKVNRQKANYGVGAGPDKRLKEHGNLILNSWTKQRVLEMQVEISKILISFRKLLIMHKCVNLDTTYIKFLFLWMSLLGRHAS